MFKKRTVFAFSIVAIVLTSLGLLLTVLVGLLVNQTATTVSVLLGSVSWILLLWGSVIACQLCTKYKLYEDEYKKVGIRVYLIILAFIFFMFFQVVAGIFIAVGLMASLWALKRNYDEWSNDDAITHEAGPDEPKNIL